MRNIWVVNNGGDDTPTDKQSTAEAECSFDTLVRSLRSLVWPQQPRKKTNGKARKIVENHSRKF